MTLDQTLQTIEDGLEESCGLLLCTVEFELSDLPKVAAWLERLKPEQFSIALCAGVVKLYVTWVPEFEEYERRRLKLSGVV